MVTQLGRYEIVEELARGAMGIVYKARDPLIDRMVAIKVINLSNLPRDEAAECEALFRHEAKAAGRLNHRNIFTLHDMGKCGDMPYIAMEILQGRELREIMAARDGLSIDEALHVATEVASGLGYAHQHGVVHHDIKPANIMVLDDSHVKIADFGIARMASALARAHPGKVLGSPAYMSPEHVLEEPPDPRSDLFSLGIVLYQMLTRRLPFNGDDARSVMIAIVNDDPPPPSALNPRIPKVLDDIVCKCLAKKAGARYQSALELADDLRACRELLRGASPGHHQLMARRHFRTLRCLAIPGGVPETAATAGGYGAMGAIFLADVATDATIQMHLLYVFPLILIGFHCPHANRVNGAVALAIALQAITFESYGETLPSLSKFTLAAMSLPATAMIAYIARVARANFLEVDHLASFDWLTGLRNRQSFESVVDMEIRRHKRYGGVFSLACIDLDHFKAFNAARGRPAGDEALKLLAQVLREELRQSDTCARVGGDSFAILMPNTAAEACRRRCEHLSARIADRMRGASFPVTASIAHLCAEQPQLSASRMLARARKALHAAKAEGRRATTVSG